MCGLSVLAKGLAGLGLPVIVFVAYLAFTGNWRRLQRAQLRYGIIVSLIACALVAVPWHHAMLIRHGGAFWNELFGDNHWRRMVIGRHGDRGTFEYFVRELGYGLLPWIALAPAALRLVGPAQRRAAGAAADERGRDREAGHHLAGRDLVRRRLRAGVAVDDEVPPLRAAGHPGHRDRRRLLHRRSDRARGGWRRAAVVALIGLPLLALVAIDLVDTQERGAALPLAVLLRLRPQQERPPLARQARFLGRADRVLRGVRARDGGAGRCRASAAGRRSGCRCAAIVFTFYLLDGFMRGVAPSWSQKGPIAAYYREPPLARGAADRVPALLARRDVLHVERDLRGADRGTDGVRSGRRGRQAQGLDVAPPRPAGVLPVRALPAGAPAGAAAARGARVVPRRRRAEQQVLPRRRPICDGRGRRCRRRGGGAAATVRRGGRHAAGGGGGSGAAGGDPGERRVSARAAVRRRRARWRALVADPCLRRREAARRDRARGARGDGGRGRSRRAAAAAAPGAALRDVAAGRARARLGDDRRGRARAVRRSPTPAWTPPCRSATRELRARAGRAARRRRQRRCASW